MNILVTYSNIWEITPFLKEIGNETLDLNYKYKHISIDFVAMGYTVFETAFAIGKALQKQRYHLVLFAGLANSLNERMKVGQVLNVINDIPFSIGRKDNHGFEHAYTLGWLNKTQKPHFRGGYVNMSNAYFNVFLPFMKTASLTCPVLEGNDELLKVKLSKFPIHIETSNGMGFHYACLFENVPFYQLRAIEYNVITKERNQNKALQQLNISLKQIIDLL
jgi:futalosine hydrolase